MQRNSEFYCLVTVSVLSIAYITDTIIIIIDYVRSYIGIYNNYCYSFSQVERLNITASAVGIVLWRKTHFNYTSKTALTVLGNIQWLINAGTVDKNSINCSRSKTTLKDIHRKKTSTVMVVIYKQTFRHKQELIHASVSTVESVSIIMEAYKHIFRFILETNHTSVSTVKRVSSALTDYSDTFEYTQETGHTSVGTVEIVFVGIVT